MSRENADENEIFLPSLPRVQPPTPPPSSQLWRSWAYSFLVWLIGMNGPTCAAFGAGARLQWGSCPLGHPAGHSRGDWWPRLLKCVWGSSSWSCPTLCWSSPLTGRASAEAPNWTVKTHRAVWYITVDTDRPRDCPPPPLLLAALLSGGTNENLWPLYGTVSPIIIHSHALVTWRTEQCFWWQRMF